MGSSLAIDVKRRIRSARFFLYVFGLENTQGHVGVRIEYLETLKEKRHEIDRYRWFSNGQYGNFALVSAYSRLRKPSEEALRGPVRYYERKTA